MHRRVNDPTRNHFLIIHHRKTNLLLNSSYRSESATLQRATTLFLEPDCSVRRSSTSTSYTTRGGNNVSRSRLPVSLRRCPDWPSATTCGHRWWDWALPHGSRKQWTHSTQLHSITVSNSDQITARFTPRRAHKRARFPTPLLSGCGHAAAVSEATHRRRPSRALAPLHPTRLPKRPSMVFQLHAVQPSNNHPCQHWHLLLDRVLAAPPAHGPSSAGPGCPANPCTSSECPPRRRTM